MHTLLTALGKTEVIEIDDVFVGKNWVLFEDIPVDSPVFAFTASYVDDDSQEIMWNLTCDDLKKSVYDPILDVWEVRIAGESIVFRLFTLNPVSCNNQNTADATPLLQPLNVFRPEAKQVRSAG